MKTILLIGAGRSSSYLIQYLSDHASGKQWQVRIGDMSVEHILPKVAVCSNVTAFVLNVNNDEQRQTEIKGADIVISMLPASMHLNVAKDCVKYRKHLVTASYVSDEMRLLHEEAQKAGVILLNECGLDPGIDHASATKVIDRIHAQGGELTLFKSYCGGLVAPEFNNNPWGYKFSWNPKNVVLAGQGTSKYIENGKYKYIPYNRLFLQTETVKVEDLVFEAYANRDSLSYRGIYHLQTIPTMLRGTLRMPGYGRAWNVLVKLGLTDDSYTINLPAGMTYRELIESYLPTGTRSTQEKLKELMGSEMDTHVLDKLLWLGLFEDKEINIKKYKELPVSPAQVLLNLLEEKWKLQANDKDMVVMQHQFEYTMQQQETKKIYSSLVVMGQDQTYTAMAKTVGLPIAIATKLILQGQLTCKGVVIPTLREIYEPLLEELASVGIQFKEEEL